MVTGWFVLNRARVSAFAAHSADSSIAMCRTPLCVEPVLSLGALFAAASLTSEQPAAATVMPRFFSYAKIASG